MSIFPTMRNLSYPGALWRGQGAKAGVTTGRWQDKRAHGARRLGGCFCSCFWRVPHRAVLIGTVRCAPICLIFLSVLHGAGVAHVR